MNILMISNTACFHQLAQILSNNNLVNCVYHYGANPANIATEKYYPNFITIPEYNPEQELKQIIEETRSIKFDLVIASGLAIPGSIFFKNYLSSIKVPYLFPSHQLVTLENDRLLTKKMLGILNIPYVIGNRINGWELFRDFYKIPKPFVVKIETRYFNGRQTIIINNDNYEEIFHSLFSKFISKTTTPLSIEFSDRIVIEDFIDIDYEISYHAIMNKNCWAYLGSARDYKNQYDQNRGVLTDSMGAYYIPSVDQKIHSYTEKIFNYLKSIGKPYKGILFLGIAVLKDGTPYVLEINARGGDPEVATIAASLTNFSDMVISAGVDAKIPEAIHSGAESVSVVIANSDQDWNNPASKVPDLRDIPNDLLFGIMGGPKYKSKHSLITASKKTKEQSAGAIFDFLKNKNLGQFYYRKDIGFLK